jgi:Leucine-rich repeat (LRR) protein
MQTLSYQNLSELPILDDDIKWLDISHNKITHLKTLPSKLEYLNCSRNNITHIVNLPNTLKTLVCSYNQITSIELPYSLERFNCMHNNIKDISFTDNLEVININYNCLPSIRYLPPKLKVILCANNLITSLPTNLPANLNTINCSNNNLFQLPNLHNNIKEIYFQKNIITEAIMGENILHYNAQNNPLVKFEDNTPEDDFYILENPILCLDFENMEKISIDEYLSYSDNNIVIKGPNEKFICYKKDEVITLSQLPYYQENISNWDALKTPCKIFDLMIIKINKETFYKIVSL